MVWPWSCLPGTRLAGQRARITNQIRAFMLERGIAVRQGSIPTVRGQPAMHAPRDQTEAGSLRHNHGTIEANVTTWCVI
jgi:hypothetical protein